MNRPERNRPLDRKAFAIARKALKEAALISREDVAAFLLHKGWEEDESPDGAIRIFAKTTDEYGRRAVLMTKADVHPDAQKREGRLAILIAADVYGYDELEMRLRIAEDRARRRERELFEAFRRRPEVAA
jgi:hypothetical protein